MKTYLDGKMQRALNEGMKELSTKSCIKFIKRKNDGTSRFNKDVDGKNLEPYLQFTQGDGYLLVKLIFLFSF